MGSHDPFRVIAMLTNFYGFFLSTLLLNFTPTTSAIDSVFLQTATAENGYHCGDFLNNTINDEFMRFFYHANNKFIRLLSRPFQHEQLFPGDSLSADVVQKSLHERTNKWLEHEQWWITVCACLLIGSALFTLLYILHRCFVCCCRSSKKPTSKEGGYESFKLVTLNTLFSIFVVINIFAAAALILSSQYATHSIEQLPDRLSSCVGDLAIYKTNTQKQIDRLLIDDFNSHTESLLQSFNKTGEEIVRRFKRGISADVFDELVDQELRAKKLQEETVPRVKLLVKDAKNMHSVISNGLLKLQLEYKQALQTCQPESMPACTVAARIISTLEVKSPTLEKLELPAEIDDHLQTIVHLNFAQKLDPIERFFAKLRRKIQEVADTRQDDAKTRIKEATDTIAIVKNKLDKNINEFDFKRLREAADQLKQTAEENHRYIQYGWYGSLVVSGIFAFIACCFLIGILFGCCGQKTTYYNDDCCVRSTGSRFYCCGIWLALLVMFVVAVVTCAMLLVGANVSNLVCDPIANPMERQDMVSFVDRFAFDQLVKGVGAGEFMAANLTLAKLISQCRAGQTFYTIFGMDRSFKLTSNGFSDDLEQFLDEMRLPSDFVTNISDDLRQASLGASSEVLESTKTFSQITFQPVEGAEELITESKRFDLEMVDQHLRGQIGTKPYSGSPVVSVLDLMRDLVPKSKILVTKMVELAEAMKHLNAEFASLNQKPENSKVQLAFNNLIEENSEIRNIALQNATQNHIMAMNNSIGAFEEHVRKSMSSEITSCTPIAKIIHYSHSAICSHTVDAFNGMWIASLISLALFVPMIMIATTLSRLYNALPYAYTKYTIHEPNSDSAFTTDDYGMHDARKFSISSPYATHSYGYQDVYPPPYINNQQQQRYR